MVRDVIECSMDDSYWVTAELSEVRVSAKGHCFLELVEKKESATTPLAKAKAVIMSYLFPMLKMTFEDATNQTFCAGLQVQLNVEVSFNEVYGYSLIVKDIDPTYTMGSLARQRQEILNRLATDGIADMNKMLVLPRPLQNIAVISSATAAGYGDFCNQLDNNTQGFRFIHKLYPATMQGMETATSIIDALDAIASDIDRWDAVAIIRGGGAVSDLTGFDNYELAACCAQFPIPIITGIGHERDTTVLDFIANTHLKTPTAVAAFLLDRMAHEAQGIRDTETNIRYNVRQQIQEAKLQITNYTYVINNKATAICRNNENKLAVMYERMCQQMKAVTKTLLMQLPQADRMRSLVLRHISNQQQKLQETEKKIALYDPEKILKRGYSITRVNGHVVLDPHDIPQGTQIITTLAGGELHSVATGSDPHNNTHIKS